MGRKCLKHDTSMTFIPVPVHPSSLLWHSIHLPVDDTGSKCYVGTTHMVTGMRSSQFLYQVKIFAAG